MATRNYTVHQATATPEEEQGSAQIKGSNRATFSSAEISLTLFYMYKKPMRKVSPSFPIISEHYTLVLGNTNYLCALGKGL